MNKNLNYVQSITALLIIRYYKVGVFVRRLGFRIGVIEGAIVVDGLAGGIHEGV